jgi:hypothetical protein
MMFSSFARDEFDPWTHGPGPSVRASVRGHSHLQALQIHERQRERFELLVDELAHPEARRPPRSSDGQDVPDLGQGEAERAGAHDEADDRQGVIVVDAIPAGSPGRRKDPSRLVHAYRLAAGSGLRGERADEEPPFTHEAVHA